MMTRAEIERANAAHNLEATRFVSRADMQAATQPRRSLLPRILAGAIATLLLAALLLAAYQYHAAHTPEAVTSRVH